MFSFIHSSSLELYGTGERYHEVAAMGMALGNTYFFSDYSNGLNTASSATFWRSDLTRITFSSKFSSNIGGINDKDINISSFSFSFPVAKSKVISFGLVPYTRSNIKLIEEGGFSMSQSSSEFVDSPLNSHSEYKFFGGISNFGQLDNFDSPGRQKHQIGPGFKKSFHLTNEMEYSIFIGPLIGLTNASADNTFMWNMELEF